MSEVPTADWACCGWRPLNFAATLLTVSTHHRGRTLIPRLAMNADELGRIAGATVRAIRSAQARAAVRGFDDDFHAMVSHCRAMHEALLDALIALEPHVDNTIRGFADRAGSSIERLEALSNSHIPEAPRSSQDPPTRDGSSNAFG